MANQYPNIELFSRDLLNTQDLDPVYCMLWKARCAGELPDNLLKRWLLAYFWFYHSGVASDIAESPDFFRTALWAFDNKWPRGAERRHFRTVQARESIKWFQNAYKAPENAIDWLGEGSFQEVAKRIQRWPMFGPWITFKVADMLERVVGRAVDFSDCELFMYKEPLAGAELVANEWGKPEMEPKDVVSRLLERLGYPKAPPRYDRSIGLSEIETCLCKFKSHRGGHYPMGKDSKEMRRSLLGRGKLAQRLSLIYQ